MRRAIRIVSLTLALLGSGALAQNVPSVSPNEPTKDPSELPNHALTASRIDIRSNPLLSLHMLARAGVTGEDVPESIRPAVEALKVPMTDWEWVTTDGLFASAEGPEQAWEVLRGPAGRSRGGDGPKVHAYIGTLELLEPTFMTGIWPAHEQRIDSVRAEIERSLNVHGPSCIARICELLGITDPAKPIPVYLVCASPPPGGFTALSPQFGAVCIVSIDAHQGSALVEATLHEAIHALDSHTRQQEPPTVLQALRKALAEAGVGATDARMRDVPHTLIFAVAAHVTRTSVDASHVAYGETGGYYAKVADAREAVLPAFQRYVAGEIDSATLVAEIVARETKPE